MSVQGTGERHSDDEDDGPPPLITDSEDEECVVSKIQEDPDAAATPCSDVIENSSHKDFKDWFSKVEVELASISLPTGASSSRDTLKEPQHAMEGIVKSVLSHQAVLLEERQSTTKGSEMNVFIEEKWRPFLESLLHQYTLLVTTLTAVYKTILRDANTVMEEGRVMLGEEVGVIETLTAAKERLLSLKGLIGRVTAQSIVIQEVSGPLHVSILSHAHPSGIGEVPLLCCKEVHVLEEEEENDQYNDAWDVVNSAENLFLECSDLVEKLNTLTAPLLDIVTKEGQRVYKSLEVLEAWVSEVRHLMSEEPQRMLDGKSHPPSLIESSTGDEIEEGEEDCVLHPELMVRSSPSDAEGSSQHVPDSPPLTDEDSPSPPPSPPFTNSPLLVLADSPPLEDSPVSIDPFSHSPGLPPPVFSSDDEEEGEREAHPLLPLTVSIDPDDHDFMDKVEQHIFSPETIKNPLSMLLPGGSPTKGDNITIVTHEQVTDLDDLNKSLADITVDDPEVTPTHSAKAPPIPPVTFPLAPDEGFSPVDVGNELYNLDKTLEDEYEDSEEEEEEGLYGDEGESEGSSLHTEANNGLEWIKSINVFEYRLSTDEVGAMGKRESDEELMTYGLLINELEVKSSSIPAHTELRDSLLSDFASLKVCLSFEDQHILHLRLDRLLLDWEQLSAGLAERTCQLKFEWSQTELVMWFQETVAELMETTPSFLLLPEEMEKSLEEFKEYFEEIDQMGNGEGLVMAVKESVEELQQFDKNEEKFKRVIARLEEAFEAICDKIQEQREFLQYGIDEWSEFESLATPLNEWIGRVEVDVLHRSNYGNTLDQSEQFMRRVVAYRQELQGKYELLKGLVEAGNNMAGMVKDDSPSHKHIDQVVRGTTTKWQRLVGGLKITEEDLSSVLIVWQEYIELYSATRDFVGHIDDIAGRDPLLSSQGNEKLLPKFVLQNEIHNFQSSVSRLKSVKDKLSQNIKFGATPTLDKDMARLEKDWSRIEGMVRVSLDMLWAEHSEWVEMRLKEMESIVSQGQGLLDCQVVFLKEYPVKGLMWCAAGQLLEVVQSYLTTHEDSLFDLRESLCSIQSDVENREKQIKEATIEEGSLSEDRVRAVVDKWETIDSKSSDLKPALQLCCSQLLLVCPLQDVSRQLSVMETATGSREIFERTLTDSKSAFSVAKFETFKQLSYDLDTVYREHYLESDRAGGLPPDSELQEVNRSLTEAISALDKQACDLHRHLVLMVEWWKEYEEEYKSIMEWFGDIQPSTNNLLQQMKAQEQSPQELLETAQELLVDVKSHEKCFKSLTVTGQNLLTDMESKQCEESGGFATGLSDMEAVWAEITTRLSTTCDQLQIECQELNAYLEKLGDFSERLNGVYAEFYDELCTAIPPNASQETINRQKQILEKFNNKIAEMSNEFKELKSEGERWDSKVIPERWMEEFREMSPGIDEAGGDSSCHSVERQLSTSENRLKKMNQMLKDRALDLELTQGDTAALMQSANELLEWVESNLNQDVLHERPPGELDRLLHNSEGIKAIRESFESRRRTLQRLHEIATSSKGTLSEANLKKIEQLMTKLDNAWEKMEESLTVTTMSTEDVLSKMEAFNTSYNEQDEWERDAKQTLDECLPIEADLDRLNEQQDILESLNSEILDHKRRPEELTLHADAILQLSQEGTGKELQDKVFRLQERFSSLEDAAAENSELCEDAKGDVQKYNELEKEFNELIVSLRESFDVLKAKPKKPVGNVQETIDSHMDYCIEVEGKSCTFTVMYDCGLRIRRKYPPSQKFAEALSKQLEEWEEFVSTVVGRWSHYVHIKELWKNFEATVKDFLEWLMAEGKSFSKDVTTLGGVKGVSDHMKTCEALKNTLKAKDKLLDDISSQAEELQDEDGEKANGTKDVDSRLNDVSIHWNSVCQLLSETLQTLDAVYKKLVLINEITLSEQEWITALGALLADKQTTHGVVELVKNEVELFKGYLDQFEEHRPSYQVIVNTESFVLEHTSCLQHDDIKKGVSEFVQEFDALEESAKDYVARLEQSIPLWEMFNKQKEYLSNWVTESQALYDGDALRPGNALVTRNSLNNAEILFEDIQSHFENVQVLNELMTQLSDLCVEGDKDFITDHTNSLSAHIDDLKEGTEGRKDLLETRMESWKAFPVQAAVDVQEFLEAVSKEVGEEEEDFDDCSTAELMEKLERLELLQSQQSRKRGSISTLDSSVSNKEVQKALEKNPDISQERNSLLKGWSSSSSQLTSNLHMLRLKAEMATKLEKKTKDCTAALDTYHQHLTAPLPHSVSLHKCQFQWKEKEVALGNDCDKVVNDLLDTHKDFKSNKKVEVPKRLNVMVNAIRSRHTTLKEKAVELTDHITQRVRDWEQFKDTMASLSDWLEGALIELTHLSDYYLYLSCFEDILDRHKLVQNQMKTKAKGYLFLQQNHRYHLVVQQKVSPPSPSIVENEEEGEEGGVSEEIGQNNPEGEEREGDEAPAVTEDPDFLHYQSQWADIDKGWGQLETSLDNFLTNKGPWEKMADVYCELDGWRDEIKGRIDTTTSRGEEIYRLGRNPGPITEAYRQFQSEINSRQPILTELHSLIEQQLPEQLRSKHLAVREFIVCCDQLQEDWTQLNTRTQELARDSVDKMEEWENRASDCMKRVPLLQHEINDKSEHIRTLEQQIGDLRKNPPYKLPPRRNCICRLLQYLILVFVPFALLSIVIILNLNEGNLFRLFRLFEKLFPFFEITASNNSFY